VKLGDGEPFEDVESVEAHLGIFGVISHLKIRITNFDWT
jgi:hypothetical protein